MLMGKVVRIWVPEGAEACSLCPAAVISLFDKGIANSDLDRFFFFLIDRSNKCSLQSSCGDNL